MIKYKSHLNLLYTTRIKVVSHLLFTNRIHPSKFIVGFLSFLASLLGSPVMFIQQVLFYGKTRKISFDNNPPLFIIGYFRSGTTHLHNILSKDKRFGTPNNYHGLFVNYCLVGGNWFKGYLAPLLPKKRIQDQVLISIDEPQEEEQAMFCYSKHNGLIDYLFPKNNTYFDKYVLFKSEYYKEKVSWKKEYLELLQIISYSIGKRDLLLKNPLNTGRTNELKSLFPKSKFIFIIRDPYEIFSSVLHWHQSLIQLLCLQKISEEELEELILKRFKLIMLKYIEVRENISEDKLVEITFEELQERPLEVVSTLYKKLQMKGVEEVLTEIKKYLDSVKNYSRNVYPIIPVKTVQKINKEWGFVFKEWGYSMRSI